jgi:hypothetical protein
VVRALKELLEIETEKPKKRSKHIQSRLRMSIISNKESKLRATYLNIGVVTFASKGIRIAVCGSEKY